MIGTSPVLFAGAVVLTFAVIGTLVLLVRNHRTFHGYREIAREAKAIASQLGGELFRDGDDLVVSGEYQSRPTLLRFSNSDNTPAMMLEVRVPSGLDLSLTPKQFPDNKVGSKVRLNNWLEQRFVARSKSPLDSELLLGQRGAMNMLVRLCCSQKTVIEIGPGKLQLFEMVVPPSLARHVLDHLADINDMARVMETLPGSDKIKIASIPRERSSWPFRAAVAAGVVVATLTVVGATRERTKPVTAAKVDSPTINGILKVDVSAIPMAEQWRVVEPSDLEPSFADFLRGVGVEPSYPINFDPDGTGATKGSAYLLTNDSGQKRIVLLQDHRMVFDTAFPNVAGMVRVPAASLNKVRMAGKVQTAGDGLLFVRKADDPNSAVILYVVNGALQSAAPSDYRTINFEPETAAGY